MSVISINFDLLHDWELSIKVFVDKFFNFSWRSTLLSKELVAWEGKDFEAIVFPSVVGFDHLCVCLTGESSLASNVDHHNKFFVSKRLKVKQFASDVIDLEIKESFVFCLFEGFLA